MAGMFGIGPSSNIMSRFAGQNAGIMDSIRRKMGGNTGIMGGMGAPRLQPGGGYSAPTTPQIQPGMPQAIDNGLRMGPPRAPRMPRVQPSIPQADYAPISPSGNVINRFLAPQPGGNDFGIPMLGGGRNMWRMY